MFIIVEKFIYKPSSNFFRGDELKQFIAEPQTQTWNYGVDPAVQVTDTGKLGKLSGRFARIAETPFKLELLFVGVQTSDADEIDLRFKMLCKVAKPRQFLHEMKARLDATHQIAVFDLAERVKTAVLPKVVDRIGRHTFTELAVNHAIPADSWQRNPDLICDAIDDLGLDLCEVGSVEYYSRKDEDRRDIEKRQREFDLQEECGRMEIALQESLKRQQLESDAKIRELEDDHRLSEQERLAKRELIHIQTVHEQELVRLRHQRDVLKIEQEIAGIRGYAEEQKRNEERRQRIEDRWEQFQDDYRQAQNGIADALKGIEEALKNRLPISMPLVNTLGGFSLPMLMNTGTIKTPEIIRTCFHELRGNYGKVPVKVLEARSRDIGVGKFDTLRVKQSLAFEFISPLSGYATIINFGTSEMFWLHAPNAYVGIDQAKVRACTKYTVPGDLIPRADLRRNGFDYMEEGPVGWEELIIIVSPTPLIGAVDIFEAKDNDPFVQLLPSRMEKLLEQLADMPQEDLAIGVLGLVVTG